MTFRDGAFLVPVLLASLLVGCSSEAPPKPSLGVEQAYQNLIETLNGESSEERFFGGDPSPEDMATGPGYIEFLTSFEPRLSQAGKTLERALLATPVPEGAVPSASSLRAVAEAAINFAQVLEAYLAAAEQCGDPNVFTNAACHRDVLSTASPRMKEAERHLRAMIQQVIEQVGGQAP
jgi:hypothetical protein